MPLKTHVTSGVRPATRTPRQIAAEFRRRVRDGLTLKPAGDARQDPERLLRNGYLPRYRIQLFHTTYYLTDPRVDESIGFFVGYVIDESARRPTAYPRIFYKDVSLVWRVGTHVIGLDGETWIGKGDLRIVTEDGIETCETAEETTNLPIEIQAAFDEVQTRAGGARRDLAAVGLVLRAAPSNRLEPYQDFSRPRVAASEQAGGLINGGHPVAWFARRHDPSSLTFARGYEPDFTRGVLEITRTGSRFYRGTVRKFRILSRNWEIQYQFVVTPRHVWIVPPQALTTDIMSYGVRTVDVEADEDLFVPGYEYHYLEDDVDPPTWHSQIPPGFAGRTHPDDPYRADASRWLNALPVIKKFRKALPHLRPVR